MNALMIFAFSYDMSSATIKLVLLMTSVKTSPDFPEFLRSARITAAIVCIFSFALFCIFRCVMSQSLTHSHFQASSINIEYNLCIVVIFFEVLLEAIPRSFKHKLLGNTWITEHNTRSNYGRPKLSLAVPRNSGNQANPKNDSP